MATLTFKNNYGTSIPMSRVYVFLVFAKNRNFRGEIREVNQYELIFWSDGPGGFRFLRHAPDYDREDLTLDSEGSFYAFLRNYINGNYTIYGIGELENLTYQNIFNRVQIYAADLNTENFYPEIYDDLITTYGVNPQPSSGDLLYTIINSWIGALRRAMVDLSPEKAATERLLLLAVVGGIQDKHPGIFFLD